MFLPDRLELVKGAPALRRAHLDQVVAALWPARAGTRGEYARALAQRNALLGAHPRRHRVARLAAGLGRRARPSRRRADGRSCDKLWTTWPTASPSAPRDLGLDGAVRLRYRPRAKATDASGLAAELAERVDADLERGFTGHGPHRDELVLERDGRELRAYGSQGQQRLALLALLLAEREALGEARGAPAADAARRRDERARRRPPRAASSTSSAPAARA